MTRIATLFMLRAGKLMLRSRIIVVAVFFILMATELTAAGPFGRRRTSRAATPPARPAFLLPLSVLHSPEKMTELFGPSILIRDETPEPAKKKSSRFVEQPSR